MFLFKASQYLKELEMFNPDIVGTCRIAMENALEDQDFLRLDAASFKACPSDSIDYAVMEKTNAAVVIRLLTAIGVEDLVIVETTDAVLVAHKDQVQDVKDIVSRLKAMKRNEAYLHRKVYRPWGYYENLDIESRYQVKHITVNPGASLSLQLHYHRSEHWVVVKGTARITRDEETFILF